MPSYANRFRFVAFQPATATAFLTDYTGLAQFNDSSKRARYRIMGRKGTTVMFTIEQINDLHTRLGSARTLREYLLALKELGVERYDSYLVDGHSEYFGHGGHTVVSPPVHEVLPVAQTTQRDAFLEHLRRHERRETTYLEMSRGLAESGIEKWTFDTLRMTMAFYDKAGTEILVEPIE